MAEAAASAAATAAASAELPPPTTILVGRASPRQRLPQVAWAMAGTATTAAHQVKWAACRVRWAACLGRWVACRSAWHAGSDGGMPGQVGACLASWGGRRRWGACQASWAACRARWAACRGRSAACLGRSAGCQAKWATTATTTGNTITALRRTESWTLLIRNSRMSPSGRPTETASLRPRGTASDADDPCEPPGDSSAHGQRRVGRFTRPHHISNLRLGAVHFGQMSIPEQFFHLYLIGSLRSTWAVYRSMPSRTGAGPTRRRLRLHGIQCSPRPRQLRYALRRLPQLLALPQPAPHRARPVPTS